jgi:hypothetical protein
MLWELSDRFFNSIPEQRHDRELSLRMLVVATTEKLARNLRATEEVAWQQNAGDSALAILC